MHEYSIVESMVANIANALEREGSPQVTVLKLRRGSAFSAEALDQAFAAVSAGTPLEGAGLQIETVNLLHKCPCGRGQVITSDDLEGHMFVCPACGRVREIDESHDLELVDVIGERGLSLLECPTVNRAFQSEHSHAGHPHAHPHG